jgi:hypothetical protein
VQPHFLLYILVLLADSQSSMIVTWIAAAAESGVDKQSVHRRNQRAVVGDCCMRMPVVCGGMDCQQIMAR